MEDTRKKWSDFRAERLEDTGGDLFSAMEALLEYGIEFCKNNDLLRLHRNLVMYPDTVLTECMENDFGFEQEAGEDFLERLTDPA